METKLYTITLCFCVGIEMLNLTLDTIDTIHTHTLDYAIIHYIGVFLSLLYAQRDGEGETAREKIKRNGVQSKRV